MKSVLKIVGLVLAVIILGVLVLAAGLYFIAGSYINNSFEVAAESLNIPTEAEMLARGEHIATAWGCKDCHTENLGGKLFVEDPAFGYLPASNLTSGQGGVGASYTNADWVKAIRHGVRPNGRSFIIMPSAEYYWLSDADLAALIAYLKSLPPVDNVMSGRSMGPVGRMLVYSGAIPLQAERIDHTAPRPEPEPGVTVEYGSYLASTCRGCHGPTLNGQGGDADPDGPPPTNLTPAGTLGQWTEADFINTLRTGTTPYGKALDPAIMPWESVGQLSDDELKALWVYLQSLPAS